MFGPKGPNGATSVDGWLYAIGMILLVKLGFSLCCALLGWLTITRLEGVLRYGRRWSSSQERSAFRFYKLMWGLRIILAVLCLWGAAFGVWISWFLAILSLALMPVLISLSFPMGRLLVRRTIRRRRYAR